MYKIVFWYQNGFLINRNELFTIDALHLFATSKLTEILATANEVESTELLIYSDDWTDHPMNVNEAAKQCSTYRVETSSVGFRGKWFNYWHTYFARVLVFGLQQGIENFTSSNRWRSPKKRYVFARNLSFNMLPACDILFAIW